MRWFVSALTLLWGAHTLAHAGEAEVARLRQAFQFTKHLLDRRVTIITYVANGAGDASYRNKKMMEIERDGTILIEGLYYSARRKILQYATIEPYPISPDSQLIKMMVARGRECVINHEGSDQTSGVSAFVEEPIGYHRPDVKDIVDYLGHFGGGVLLGYLLLSDKERVHIDDLLTAEWTASSPNVFICYHGTRRIVVTLDADNHPQTIEITPAVVGVAQEAGKYYRHSELFELKKWLEFEGVEVPSEVNIWTLLLTTEKKWRTTNNRYEIQEVGPVVQVSDRYGDFFTGIPNGTRVQVDDYLGIDFIWQDGEIVRKVDRVKLSALVGQPFFGSPRRRYLWIGLGLVGLAAVGWLVWRYSGRHL